MKKVRYAAWGIDKSFRYKWMANLAQWLKWGPYGGGWKDFLNALFVRRSVRCNRSDLVDLIMYSDTASRILADNGFAGKAEALEKRYMKIANSIGMKHEP
jgi:hypothetical protein